YSLIGGTPLLLNSIFLTEDLNPTGQTADGSYVSARTIVRWRPRGWVGMVALGSVALMLAAVMVWTNRPPQPGRTLRIGFQNSPPYHFPDAEGHPSGPAVDLIRVAAREEGIQLEWVFAQGGPE